MKGFILSDRLDKQKVFLTKISEVEKRLDPFYYIPSIRELERSVRKLSPQPLRSYVRSVSSGATPKTTEAEKYYSGNEKEGIPFLRVQNLSPTGYLQLEDCKYINKETHNGLLKRSQVSGGDLLVKITGVGRMAIASVAPDDFVGNINQHIVVIKTENKEQSTIIAAYLNSDIGEKLARRRATGGTRPALDYSALLSIPIIYDNKILAVTEKAVLLKHQKESQSKQLLDSINEYLLNELGIMLPEKDNSLENRIFTIQLSKVGCGRFDPFYFLYSIESPQSTIYKEVKLKVIATIVKGQSLTSSEIIEGEYPVIAGGQTSPYSHNQYNHLGNAITISASGAYSGFVRYHKTPFFASDCSVVKSRNEESCNTEYLFNVLKLKQKELYNLQQGSGQPHVYPSDINKVGIPLPDIDKQLEINEHIGQIRVQADKLQKEAVEELEKAKQKIEQIILGNQ